MDRLVFTCAWKPAYILMLAICLSACSGNSIKQHNSTPSNHPTIPFASDSFFSARPSIIDMDEIYTLSSHQKADFLAYFDAAENKKVKANRRIYRYLQQYVKNYSFLNKTLTAEQSIQQSQGNCLSLAILTTALANIADVETGYQLVESAPVYQKENNIILSSQHVRSLLFEPKVEQEKGIIALGRNALIVDYFPTRGSHLRRTVYLKEFTAMFYRNKAADAIIDRNYDLAYWLLRETFLHLPVDEHAVNMMAVVHENKGLKNDAENLYRYGIKYAVNKLDLLRNYQLFLKKEHRMNDAKIIKSQLASMKSSNPFDWINLAHSAFSQKKYSEARRYFKRAVKLAPYLHQAHMGVAKTEFKLGNLRLAKQAMSIAKETAFDSKTKSLYSAKIAMLEKQ